MEHPQALAKERVMPVTFPAPAGRHPPGSARGLWRLRGWLWQCCAVAGPCEAHDGSGCWCPFLPAVKSCVKCEGSLAPAFFAQSRTALSAADQ